MKKEKKIKKHINKAPAEIALSQLNLNLVQSPCSCIRTVFGYLMKSQGKSINLAFGKVQNRQLYNCFIYTLPRTDNLEENSIKRLRKITALIPKMTKTTMQDWM